MIRLNPAEAIDLVVRRHWFTIIAASAVLALLLFAPLVVILVRERSELLKTAPLALIGWGSTLWWLLILLLFYIELISWWLDVWIITTERIIDIEQKSLFHREVSEIPLTKIQDVTLETPGLIASLLHFGNVTVQTAGLESFTIREAHYPERVKELLAKRIMKAAPN